MNFLKQLISRFTGTKKPSLPNMTSQDTKTLKTLDPRIVIGKIMEITEHPDPNITKVRVTKTQVKTGEIVQILCGGKNIAVGMIVPVATVGADLGGGFVIGEREIRGQQSLGMICARAELGLTPANEQKGDIWPLPTEFEAHIGTSIKDFA